MQLSDFRDPELTKELLETLRKLCGDRTMNLMEVCGTHTVSIGRYGLRKAVPEGVKLLSGPGCPVCVTSNHDIDTAIAMARVPNVTVATFGDMVRVPGSSTTLGAQRAHGADIRVVYSPLDALEIARKEPQHNVVFIGVGFETTMPVVGASIQMAAEEGLQNYFVLSAHKRTAPALEVIANDPQTRIDGFILPGHVSTITGVEPYRFLAETYGIGGVVTGFEPVDILNGITRLAAMVVQQKPAIENAYSRGVNNNGNLTALATIKDVFEPCDAQWRGLGVIPLSGMRIAEKYRAFDALEAFEPDVEPVRETKGCRCGDVLRGRIAPDACPLFGRACNPENPVGPCMVSSEGSCAAYYRYRDTPL
ncbi:MAG: hydrogenase formation protein HypD [Coriobacteriales bacterium]|nr:hydrogenase formation protein HypD [Coriobacteriales bacterium]